MSRVIKVPTDIPGPLARLCFAPQPLGEGMARCDRQEHHKGRHSWERDEPDEYVELLAEADYIVTRLRGVPHYQLTAYGQTRGAALAMLADVVRSAEAMEAKATVACLDCGLRYEDFPLDMVLPDDQWRLIHPEVRGVLCALCIVRRAAKLKGVTVVFARLDDPKILTREDGKDLYAEGLQTGMDLGRKLGGGA